MFCVEYVCEVVGEMIEMMEVMVRMRRREEWEVMVDERYFDM